MEPAGLQVEPDRSGILGALVISEVRFLRDCLINILSRMPAIRVCGQAATAANALASAEATRPGVVLLDVAFPEGIQTASDLCDLLPDANIVALGIRETEENVLAWAEAGIVGYVPNTASVDDLIRLLGQISRGEQSCPSHIAGSLLRRIAASGRAAAVGSAPSALSLLTCREQEIFRLVSAGLCNKDIARRLCISLGTTKSHVHNLLGKLSLHRRADVMAQARRSTIMAP